MSKIKKIENGGITSAKGFKAAGIFCGIKKKKKDLALIYSEYPAVSAGTFTVNKARAACVEISENIVKKYEYARAILINSGSANACTGVDGYNDALKFQAYLASKLNLNPNEILISSTGVIGQRIPEKSILFGIDQIVNLLSIEGGKDAAEAIMTTDTKPKSFAYEIEFSKGKGVIGGICKGSGMIMPNMATMLGFIVADVKVSKKYLQKTLKYCVDKTFNRISVDGETSTNDMVIALANGASSIEITSEYDISESDIKQSSNFEDAKLFEEALLLICDEMAESIVKDGEGATKFIKIIVTGAHSESDADIVGKAIANSNLVKTAIYGGDANWGRIVSAVANSGANIDPSKLSVSFGDIPILEPNFNSIIDESKAAEYLKKSEIELKVNLNGGECSAIWRTCDLTENYVKINANYRT